MPSTSLESRRDILRAAGATLSASLAGCTGGGHDVFDTDLACSEDSPSFRNDWPLYGYDARNTGANPNATGPKDGVEVRWTDGDARILWGTPVVADDTVYVQESPTRLTAFARPDGTERWSVRLGTTDESKRTDTHSGPHATPAVVGDTVYVGGGNAEVEKDGMESNRVAEHFGLYAADRHTGDVRWTVRPDDFLATAPVAVGDAVLFATLSGTVHGVDTEAESVSWTFSVGESRGVLLATPAVADCRLYLPTLEHGLYALDAATGDLDWRLPSVESRAAPAVADGTVYVGGRDEFFTP